VAVAEAVQVAVALEAVAVVVDFVLAQHYLWQKEVPIR
jgi:hypothetical protein